MTKTLTSGNPLKLIFKFSIPILIGNLVQQFYQIVDSIFVSQFVGLKAFAGLNSAHFLTFLIFGFVFGMCNGCAILLAQRFGAKSKQGIKLSIVSSVYIYIIITIVMTIISIITLQPVLKLMGTPNEIMPYAKTYAIINFIGIFAIMAYNLFSQMLRAISDNLAALFFLFISAILNIFLDYFAVVVFNLGVAGAAVATVMAQAISAAACLIYMFKKYEFTRPKKIHWHFNKTFFFKQLQLGLPLALECSVCGIGLIIVQNAINHLGTNVVAGFAIAMKIEDLILAVFLALASAATVFTAQNYGANQILKIRKGAKASILLCVLTCVIFSTIFILGWNFLVQLFINKSDQLNNDIIKVKLAASQYINVVLPHYIMLGTLIIMRSIVQALSKTFIPLCGGFIELIARIFGAAILGKYFNYHGICYATILAWWLAGILIISSYIYYIKQLTKSNSPTLFEKITSKL